MAHDSGRTVIISAGIGTSVVPIRLGAPPDLWLITLGPPRAVDRATAR
jgi:predicted MPP superfamily phosphohydrolase